MNLISNIFSSLKIVAISSSLVSVSAYADKVVRYKCEYKSYSNELGIHKYEEAFGFSIIVDHKVGKAYIHGNNGADELKFVENNDGGIGFIEVTPSGNIQTTVISKSGKSVHSRHTTLIDELMPSQSYGKCSKK